MSVRYLLAAAAALLVLAVPAFAAEEQVSSNTYVTVEAADFPETSTIVNDLISDEESRSAFVAALESIFGEYQPQTYSVTTYLPDGSTITSVEVVPGLAGLDYAWISGVGLFALFLFCLLKLIGGVVK